MESDFLQLKKNLKKDFDSLKKIRVALLGDSATQFLTLAIRGAAFERGFDLQIFEADFNQIERQIYDPSSELYEYKPEIIIAFQSTHKLLGRYNKCKLEKQSSFCNIEMESLIDLYATAEKELKSKMIFYNYTEIDDSVFGNYANRVESSFLFQLRKINYELMLFSSKNEGFYICDLSTIQNQVGKTLVFQPSIYVNTDMVLSIEVLPRVAYRTIDIITSLNGKIKKCIIIDLDNTTWGGIIGDDGIENIQIGSLGIGKAFSEFQHWVKKLKNRGIIVAVCTKNTESVAKEPFEKHPDMVLKLEDIAIFVANWDNKVDNIRYIQNVLNIGFDSMVFIDDNPFERNMVRENIQGVFVPELPVDPSEYLEYLYSLNLFETVSFSNEDIERTKLYQIEAKRATIERSYSNQDDFLESLKMRSLVESFNNFNIPRVAQLSQRSNQFNLRTVRYTAYDLEVLSKSENNFTFAFNLEDKFGDNGLICVLILKIEDTKTLFIDTWFMSCRVLKRGMENFVLNTISDFAKSRGYLFLKGEFIPTSKNEMVRDHYEILGFKKNGEFWILETKNYSQKTNFIEKK